VAENLGVKNAGWDREDGYIVPRDCYNSYFYIVEDETTNLLDKFILHGQKFTKYLDGGSALHGNLNEHLTKEQYLKMLDIAITTGCPYFTFNIPNTICNDCGFISKNRLTKCSKCGSENLDYITRIIGYLKRVSKFSEPRQKEANTRYYE
jgi:ribonucleoside-triphosphate reductase